MTRIVNENKEKLEQTKNLSRNKVGKFFSAKVLCVIDDNLFNQETARKILITFQRMLSTIALQMNDSKTSIFTPIYFIKN